MPQALIFALIVAAGAVYALNADAMRRADQNSYRRIAPPPPSTTAVAAPELEVCAPRATLSLTQRENMTIATVTPPQTHATRSGRSGMESQASQAGHFVAPSARRPCPASTSTDWVATRSSRSA